MRKKISESFAADGAALDDDDDDGDANLHHREALQAGPQMMMMMMMIYIYYDAVFVCLCVTKNHHFLLGVSCNYHTHL